MEGKATGTRGTVGLFCTYTVPSSGTNKSAPLNLDKQCNFIIRHVLKIELK